MGPEPDFRTSCLLSRAEPRLFGPSVPTDTLRGAMHGRMMFLHRHFTVIAQYQIKLGQNPMARTVLLNSKQREI